MGHPASNFGEIGEGDAVRANSHLQRPGQAQRDGAVGGGKGMCHVKTKMPRAIGVPGSGTN